MLFIIIKLNCGLLNSPCTCTLAHLSQLMQGFFGGGETALHAACEHGHVDVANLLLQHGAVVDSQDEVSLLYVSVMIMNMVCREMAWCAQITVITIFIKGGWTRSRVMHIMPNQQTFSHSVAVCF